MAATGNKGIGGPQPGAGRKKAVDEQWARKTCIDAIKKKYGSVEEGIEAVMNGNDERIKLLIWQHILGVPETISKVKLSDSKGNKLEGGLTPGVITVNVVRTVHNKDVVVGDKKEGE